MVTKPFTFEGTQRRRIAESTIGRLRDAVDTLITVPNDRLLQIADSKMSIRDSFVVADDVLRQGIQGISELITVPGLINLDFADVRAIMLDGGAALMSIGRASGENRAQEAAQQAIQSSLLDISIEGAQGILFNVKGGDNLGLNEVSEAAELIRANAHPEANIIFGAVIDENMKDEIHMTVIATGFDKDRRPEQSSASTRQPYAKRHAADRLDTAVSAAVAAAAETQGADRLPGALLRPRRPGHLRHFCAGRGTTTGSSPNLAHTSDTARAANPAPPGFFFSAAGSLNLTGETLPPRVGSAVAASHLSCLGAGPH